MFSARSPQRLGYTPRAGLTDVERFMKHYFLIAKDVGDLTAIVCAALEERQAKPRPVLDRFIGRLRRRSSVIADAKDFKIEFDRISVVRSDVFERDPINLIRLFWVADRSNLRHSSRRHAPRHPFPQAHRRGACATIPRPTGCSSKS